MGYIIRLGRATKRCLTMYQWFFIILALISTSHFASAGELVDINRADAVQIASALDGIGQKKAEKIVAWRNTHGAFKSVADVALVTGIGAKLAERNKSFIQFSSHNAASIAKQNASQTPEKGTLTLPIGAYSSR